MHGIHSIGWNGWNRGLPQESYVIWMCQYIVLWDKKVPPKLESKFYRVLLDRPCVWGGGMTKQELTHSKNAYWEMRMLRKVLGILRINVVIQEKVRVASMVYKVREARLKRFGPVMNYTRCIDAIVRRCERLVINFTWKGGGKPKNYWKEVIR